MKKQITLACFQKTILAHPGKAGTLAGWFQQICTAGSAILLVPILLRYLPADRAGTWFSFQGMIAVANLADFGFGFAVARQVAFCMGQQSDTSEHGDFLKYGAGWHGVANLLKHAKQIYMKVNLVSAAAAIFLFEVILPFTKFHAVAADYRLMWYVMTFSALVLLNLGRWNALLTGLTHLYVVRLLSGSFFLLQGVTVAIAAMFTQSLLAMALASLASVLVYWAGVLSVLKVFAKPLQEFSASAIVPTPRPRLFQIAAPIGVVNISAYLVSSIQVPLIGSILGPAVVTPYYLAQKIGQFLNLAAMQTVQPQLPIFTKKIACGDKAVALYLMKRTILIASLCIIFSNLVFLFFGKSISAFLSSGIEHISDRLILAMAMDYLILGCATIWGQFVLAAGKNPFVISTILNGIFNLMLLIVLVPKFGLVGVPLSGLCSGLLTNYWFTIWRGVCLSRDFKN